MNHDRVVKTIEGRSNDVELSRGERISRFAHCFKVPAFSAYGRVADKACKNSAAYTKCVTLSWEYIHVYVR